jgi:hypothetical protein
MSMIIIITLFKSPKSFSLAQVLKLIGETNEWGIETLFSFEDFHLVLKKLDF